MAHFDRGEFEAAAECFEALLSAPRGLGGAEERRLADLAARARACLGHVCLHAGDDERAGREFSLALRANPRLADARYWRARVRERCGLLIDAVEDLESAIADDPDHAEACLLLAVCLAGLGHRAGGEAALDRALELVMGLPHAMAPRFRLACDPVPQLARAVAHRPSFADLRCRLAARLLEAGRTGEALEQAEAALAINPHYLEAGLVAARARLECGDCAGAARQIEAIVGERPDYPDLHFWLGLARLRAGEFAAAEGALERAVALHRTFARAHRLLGLVYHALGRDDDALRGLRRGLVRDRELPGDVLPAATPPGPAAQRRAEPGLARALALRPEYPDLHLALAREHRENGDLEAAAAACREALARAPGLGAAALELADIEMILGRPATAEAVLRELLRREPGWADAHAALGRARLALGDAQGAEPALRASLRLNPGWGAARADLGWALRAQYRARDADAEFARALELDPLRALPRMQRAGRERSLTARRAAG